MRDGLEDKTRPGLTAAAFVGRSGWWLYPLLIFVALSSWAVSSPPGSAPDDDFHLISTWCSHGIRDGLCMPGTNELTRIVPLDLTQAPCFAFEPKESGVCPHSPGQFVETTRGNFSAYYPGAFYWVMGFFAGPSLPLSVVVMRLLNSIIYAGGLAALLSIVPRERRTTYMLGSVVSMVPLGIFIVASTNPSSWAVSSATLAWASATEFFRGDTRQRRVVAAALVVFALFLGFAARADATAYAVLAIGLAWVGTLRLTRRTLILGAVAGVLVVGATFWTFSFGSATMALTAPPVRPDDYAGGWLQRLQDLPALYVGVFGLRGLGWLDTSMRSATWVLAAGAFVAASFWGLRRCGWRKATSLAIIIAVGALAPVVLSTLRHAWLAEMLQPRYFLPVVVMLALVAVAGESIEGVQLNWAQGFSVIAALGIANANALHTNLRRYITGIDGKWFNLNHGIEWWWASAPSPMVVFGLGSLAFVVAVGIAVLDFAPRYQPARAMAVESQSPTSTVPR